MTGYPSHTLDIENPFGGNPFPVIYSSRSNAERSSEGQAPAPIQNVAKVLHGANDSRANIFGKVKIIGALRRDFCRTNHNEGMSKTTRPIFDKGPPRHFIREWRKLRGLTLMQLAEKAEVTHGAISQLETGKAAYTQPMLEALAKALEVEPGILVTRHPDDVEYKFLAAIQKATPEQRAAIAAMADALVSFQAA